MRVAVAVEGWVAVSRVLVSDAVAVASESPPLPPQPAVNAKAMPANMANRASRRLRRACPVPAEGREISGATQSGARRERVLRRIQTRQVVSVAAIVAQCRVVKISRCSYFAQERDGAEMSTVVPDVSEDRTSL